MQELSEVINWRRLNDQITLSGQPTEGQLAQIKDMGVSHIINLGPHSNKGALPDEPGTVAALGMDYTYIPVKFQTPKETDFAAFCKAIEKDPAAKIHVHCIYNARVSAFFYKYAKEGRGGSTADALALMDSIWRPGADWAGFLGMPEVLGRLNLYKGDDY